LYRISAFVAHPIELLKGKYVDFFAKLGTKLSGFAQSTYNYNASGMSETGDSKGLLT
jgi:hypothetical protein